MKPGLFKWLNLCLLVGTAFFARGQNMAKNDGRVLLKADTAIQSNFRITKNDEINISSKAERVVKRFMDLLIFISTGLDLEVPEVEKIIRESYSHPDNKIFYDSTILIEDDLRPLNQENESKEKRVVDYLKDFDLLYKKNNDASVVFSNFRTSKIKKGQFLYIKVFYDCLFSNKSRISNDNYSLQKRVAELKLDKQDNKWRAYIIDVHFQSPKDEKNGSENDIAIVEDSPGNTGLGNAGSNAPQPASDETDLTGQSERRRVNDSVRTYRSFRNLIDSGNIALNNKKYVNAYRFFNEAEVITKESTTVISKSDVAYLQTMIQQARKNIDVTRGSSDDQYNQYMKEALFAENARRYNDALENYTLALSKKPEEAVILSAKIQELKVKVDNLARLEAKFMAGQYKAAIDEYDKALKKDPANADYLIGRGKCYERLENYDQALKDYKRAIESDPYNLQAHKLKAVLQEIKGDYAGALATYTVCADLEKTNITILQKIAWLNVNLGNTGAAIDILDRAIAIDNKLSLLHNLKGELQYKLNKPNEALLSFTKAISIDSSKAYPYYFRGLVEVDLKKITKAGEDFAKAKIRGLDSSYFKRIEQISADFFKSGLSHYDAGRTDSALTWISHAISIDPDKHQYTLKRGEIYFKLNDLARALQDFDEAVYLNPQSHDAYKQRGMLKFTQSNYAEAVSDFTEAIKLNPKLPQTYKYLGDAYLKSKKYSNAITSYDAALSTSKAGKPSLDDIFLADLYNNKGESHFQSGDLSSALQHFNTAVRKNMYAREFYFNRGKTYLKLNELEKAQEDLEKAIEKNVGSAQWYFLLGELYQRIGKYDRAIYHYNFCLSANPADSIAVSSIYNRANCFVNLSNYASALKDFRTIISSKAENRFANFNMELGELYIRLNNPDSALIFLNNAFIKDSLNSTAIYLISVAYINMKQSRQALLWLEKALVRLPAKITRLTVTKDFAFIKDEKPFRDLIDKYFGRI
ncbi:MAG: tetratricopeptide repeat protein [Chitinophagaceae bacterium]